MTPFAFIIGICILTGITWGVALSSTKLSDANRLVQTGHLFTRTILFLAVLFLIFGVLRKVDWLADAFEVGNEADIKVTLRGFLQTPAVLVGGAVGVATFLSMQVAKLLRIPKSRN